MKTQRLEYFDILDIFFSGKSTIWLQTAIIKKILTPTKKSLIKLCLDKTNLSSLSFDLDIKKQQSIIIEKTPQTARSIYQGEIYIVEEINSIDNKKDPCYKKKTKKLTGNI